MYSFPWAKGYTVSLRQGLPGSGARVLWTSGPLPAYCPLTTLPHPRVSWSSELESTMLCGGADLWAPRSNLKRRTGLFPEPGRQTASLQHVSGASDPCKSVMNPRLAAMHESHEICTIILTVMFGQTLGEMCPSVSLKQCLLRCTANC